MMTTDQQKLDCVSRELNIRCFAYPKWVKSGRITQLHADTEIALMRSIRDDYQGRIDMAARNLAFAR